MKFGLSEGMILAASDDEGLCLLTPMTDRAVGASIS
jgi:tRNA-binding EMAP/Myf-like protein